MFAGFFTGKNCKLKPFVKVDQGTVVHCRILLYFLQNSTVYDCSVIYLKLWFDFTIFSCQISCKLKLRDHFDNLWTIIFDIKRKTWSYMYITIQEKSWFALRHIMLKFTMHSKKSFVVVVVVVFPNLKNVMNVYWRKYFNFLNPGFLGIISSHFWIYYFFPFYWITSIMNH